MKIKDNFGNLKGAVKELMNDAGKLGSFWNMMNLRRPQASASALSLPTFKPNSSKHRPKTIIHIIGCGVNFKMCKMPN